MSILLGLEEKIHCIRRVDLTGPSGERLCLADKTTTGVIGAGLFLRDDGYVLAVVPTHGGKPSIFFPLTRNEIDSYQQQGLLPAPLPDYSIPLVDYVWGYSLWIILAAAVAWGFYSTRHLKGARRAYPPKS